MRKIALILFALNLVVCAFAQSTEDSWEELYEKGKYYREHSNSFRAMEYLEKAEQLHSSDTIRRELALTCYNRGKFQKCIDLCRSVLYPDTLDADLYLMARSFEKMEKLDSALVYQYMVADRNIENYNNLVSLCNTLISSDAIDDALQLLDAYCAIDSANSSINTVKAYALHKAGRYDEAVGVYSRLKEEGDDRSSTNYYLGLSYYLSKKQKYKIAMAYELLRRAVDQTQRKNAAILARFAITELALNPGTAPLNESWLDESRLRIIGDSYLKEELKGFSLASFKEVAAKTDSLNQQGKADMKEAIELMQPNKDMLFYLYNHCGNKMAEVFKTEEAIEYYNLAKSVYSDRYNLYYQLAVQYHRIKDYRKEMQSYENYIKYAPANEDPETIQYAKECIAECKKVLFMKDGK